MIARTLNPILTLLGAALLLWGCGPSVDSATRTVLSAVPEQVEAGQPLGLTATIQTNQFKLVEAYEGNVTVSIEIGPTTDPAVLAGATTVKAVKGVATFTDLAITRVGEGYVLKVKPETVSGGRNIPEAKTDPITVIAGPPAGISVATQPGKAAPGGLIYPFPRVAVADAHGNVISTGSAQVTVSLGANPGGSVLSGTTTLATTGGVAEFSDLSLDKLGTGYTLTFSGGSVGTVSSTAFDVAQPRLVYTDPTLGRLRLVKNAALSSDSSVVLELRASQPFTGYAVGFNIPTDSRVVRLGTPGITDGAGGLDPGTAPSAMGAALATSGRMANVFTAGVSQKASGGGAVITDTAVAPETVLFSVKLDMVALPLFKAAFDGTTELPYGFEAAVRDRTGTDVVGGQHFGIGRLAVE